MGKDGLEATAAVPQGDAHFFINIQNHSAARRAFNTFWRSTVLITFKF